MTAERGGGRAVLAAGTLGPHRGAAVEPRRRSRAINGGVCPAAAAAAAAAAGSLLR